MDSLIISTGEKRIAINGDQSRVIAFTPSDVVFAEKFYRLIGDFEEKFAAFQEQGKQLDADNAEDENGLPVNMAARIDLAKNACAYMREQIDSLFGSGTSDKAFGDVYSLGAIEQFFSGITPFIQTARVEKIAKYTNKKPKRIK